MRDHMPRLFILNDDREPVPARDFMQWAEWCERDMRRVALTTLADGSEVSTVFIGCLPALFETAHLRRDGTEILSRTSTWQAAEQAHADAVARLIVAARRAPA